MVVFSLDKDGNVRYFYFVNDIEYYIWLRIRLRSE